MTTPLWLLKLLKLDPVSKDQRLREKHRKRHGYFAVCPVCNAWEHKGKGIATEHYDNETDKRTCGECGYVWRALVAPLGCISLKNSIWSEHDQQFISAPGDE